MLCQISICPADLTDKLSLGVGISAPFGLATEYDRGWIGHAQSIKSEVRTINYNPSLAYRVSDKVSLGFRSKLPENRCRVDQCRRRAEGR